jgi:hypothetical protein
MLQQLVTSNSIITNINSTKFLGLIIDSTLSWKDHIAELTRKLDKACYAIRTQTFLRSPEVMRMVYFSYFHSIISYRIIFWCNSHHSINIFKIKKRIIWITTNSNRCHTCRPLLKQLQILPLPSQYIFSYLFYLIHKFITDIPVIMIICIYHWQAWHWSGKALHILDEKFTTTYHHKLKIFWIMSPSLNLQWRNFFYNMFL